MLRFKASTLFWTNGRSPILRERLCEQTRQRGFGLIELLIVLAMLGIIMAVALPQVISSRRLVRSAAIPRQILGELRLARQQAMTQRQAFTVQYDDLNKQLVVINHQASGAALLVDPNYPLTSGSVQERVVSLSGSGVNPDEITYGRPASLPTSARGPLDDGVNRTPLVNRQVNITFQPNGSIVDETGNPANKALFIYNSAAGEETAFAVSILGAAGRVKVWTYSSSAQKYVE